MSCFQFCCGKLKCLRWKKERDKLQATVSMDAMVVKDEMDSQQMCDENVPRDDDGKMGAENSTILNLSVESKIDEEITEVDTGNVLICENKDENLEKTKSKQEKGKFKKLVTGAFVNVAFDHYEPELCVDMMKQPNMKTIVVLKKQIERSDSNWILNFLECEGLCVLLDCVDTLSARRVCQLADALLLLQIIQCVKAVINCKVGMEYIVKNSAFTRKLVKCKLLIFLFKSAFKASSHYTLYMTRHQYSTCIRKV